MCLEPESLDLAYQLRYQAYFQADAIPQNDEERCTDPYDDQRNARTYLIWYEGRPVASVRSLTWSAAYDWDPTPSVKYFAKDVDRHLGIQTPLLESNRYVVAPDFQGRQSLRAQMLLFRIQTLGTLADGCEYVITAVRPRHVRFYERFMNFEAISGVIRSTGSKLPRSSCWPPRPPPVKSWPRAALWPPLKKRTWSATSAAWKNSTPNEQ